MSRADDFKAWCGVEGVGGRVTFQYDGTGRVCAVMKRVPLSLKPVYERLGQLKSPNLPQILDIAEQTDCLLVREAYIPGRSLRQILAQEGPLTDERLLPIARELAGALSLLHSQKPPIIHRDIKPENIMLSDAGHYVLIDFDAARQYEAGGSADTVYLGTHGYAPPEQYGFSQTDGRSDIFALGATLYGLRMGRPYQKNAVCDGVLAGVIGKCTRFDADKRYQSAGELCRALSRLDRPRPGRRIGVLAAGLLTALLAACWFTQAPSPSQTPPPPALPPTPWPSAIVSASAAAPAPTAPLPLSTPRPSSTARPEGGEGPVSPDFFTEEAKAYLALAPVAAAEGAQVVIHANSLGALQDALERALEAPENYYLCVIEGELASPGDITVPANFNLTVNPGGELRMEEGTLLINNGHMELDGTAKSPGRLSLAPGATLYCCNEFVAESGPFCPRLIVENGILRLGADTAVCRAEDPREGSSSRLLVIMGPISRIECDSPETLTLKGEGFIWLEGDAGCPEGILDLPAIGEAAH